MNVATVLLISLFTVVQGDISDTNPPSNICLCVNHRNCVVRDAACGTVTEITTTGYCYTYTGQKRVCESSGEMISYFETNINGQRRWIEGIDLIFGIGPECGILDACVRISCQNNGTCFNHLNGYVCDCLPGYVGVHCEIEIDECESNPCLNGATCIDQINRYTCICAPGYTGTDCETDIDECGISPCMNGGTCNDLINGFTCSCSLGYTGTHCETNINECLSIPCLNGATCIDLIDGFECNCSPGYTGINCETNIGDFILRNTAAGSNSYYFHSAWSVYKQGFGSMGSIYWIGLDRLHDLSQRGCAVRFDLQDLSGTWYYAQYSTFVVGDSFDYYRLTVGGFTGNVSDVLTSYHNNMQFSTYDHGPVQGCATRYYGGWWYNSCCTVCLTLSPSGYFHWGVIALNVADVRFVC